MLLDLTSEPDHKVDVSAILARYNSNKTFHSMDPYDFHRRQRQQRERDLLAARQAKEAERTYRMSLRALDVAPLLKMRDAELSTRLRMKEHKQRSEKLSPAVRSSRGSIFKRVKSLGGGSSRPKMSSANPMFGSERSNEDDYVVSTPFVLPLNVQPAVRAPPPTKPGDFFQSDMKRIIADALVEKGESERDLLSRVSSQNESEDEEEEEESTVTANREKHESYPLLKQDEENQSDGNSSVTVEEEEEEQQEQQVSGGGIGKFFTGLLAKKEPVPVSEEPVQANEEASEVSPAQARAWPAWMGKLGGAKNVDPAAVESDLEREQEDATPQESGIGKWFKGLKAGAATNSTEGVDAAVLDVDGEQEEATPQESALGKWFNGLKAGPPTATTAGTNEGAAVVDVEGVQEEATTQESGIGKWFKGLKAGAVTNSTEGVDTAVVDVDGEQEVATPQESALGKWFNGLKAGAPAATTTTTTTFEEQEQNEEEEEEEEKEPQQEEEQDKEGEEEVAAQGKIGQWFGGLMAPSNKATSTEPEGEGTAGKKNGWGAWASTLGGKKKAAEVVPATPTDADL